MKTIEIVHYAKGKVIMEFVGRLIQFKDTKRLIKKYDCGIILRQNKHHDFVVYWFCAKKKRILNFNDMLLDLRYQIIV